jgi:raffinose/stachyose/melibiose transport system permease protein
LLSLLIQLPLSIGLALLLNGRIRGRSALRLIVFTPYVLSEAVTAVVWLSILQPNGLFDQLLKAIGLGGSIHEWLADGNIVLYTLFAVITWKYIGFGIILMLAGLQGIPTELREAAALEATSWQTTRHITLPLLGPTIRIWIFLSIIGALQLFDLIWIMTLGGPAAPPPRWRRTSWTTASGATSSDTAARWRSSSPRCASYSHWPTRDSRSDGTPPEP